MPRYESPYYNPMWDEAAGRFSEALFGNPEKAGQVAYHQSQSRLNSSKADRQDIENRALTGGLAAALATAGNDPNTIATQMPDVLQAMAASGIDDPGKFTSPWWAISGEAQSGASPDEALVRAAYAGQGKAIPTDLALTPERQDEIRRDKAQAVLTRALATASSRGGGRGAKPKVADINTIINSFLSTVPGATYQDQYSRQQVEPDFLDFMASSGLSGRMREVAMENYGGGEEAARQALADTLAFPPGTRFEPEAVVTPGSWFFNMGQKKAPSFVAPDGSVIDLSTILAPQGAAPAMPGAAPPTPQQAMDELRRRGIIK